MRTPALEIGTRPPFVRRRKPNPFVQVLKFAVGLGLGFLIGGLIAALLAPAAGEDTRRRLRGAAEGLRKDFRALKSGPDHGQPTDGRVAPTDGAISGLIAQVQSRFHEALEAAKREREEHERELHARFHVALHTGHVPDEV